MTNSPDRVGASGTPWSPGEAARSAAQSVPSSQAAPAKPASAAPTSARSRAFAPDIARGLMLLLVMIANSTAYIVGREPGLLWRPTDPGPLDRVVDVIAALFIDNRAMPMFAFLFAYGIHQIASRETSRGASKGRIAGLLARRNAWLLVIGAAHFLLLFAGDIMTLYAACGFALILLVRAPNWVLWLVLGLCVLPGAFLMGYVDAGTGIGNEGRALYDAYTVSLSATSVTEAVLVRAQGLLPLLLTELPFGAIYMLAPMSLALLLARLSVLERPWEHPRLVAVLGWGGLAAAIPGGLPFAQGLAFGFQPDLSWALAGTLSNLTGVLAGAGWPCLIALAVSRRQREHETNPAVRPGPIGSAQQALGKRSMSGYIAQSICSVILFPPYTLGLGSQLGTFGMTVVSIAIWTTTLIAASILERLGKPGPMEWLFRRLSYGRQ